jgi:hypothetical protein
MRIQLVYNEYNFDHYENTVTFINAGTHEFKTMNNNKLILIVNVI